LGGEGTGFDELVCVSGLGRNGTEGRGTEV
jgi:hypothetical protein